MPVKGSRIDELVIVPRREGGRWRTWLLVALLYVASLALAAWIGLLVWNRFQVELLTENRALKADVQALRDEIGSLKSDVALNRHGSEVTRQAEETLRQTILSLEEQLSEVSQEVAYYKAIMAPGELKEGLRIERLELTPTVDANRFRYKLLLAQVANHRQSVSGSVEVTVVGTVNGAQRVLPLNELDPQVGTAAQGFRFRYFQNFSGDMVLPAGFVPERVMVAMRPSGQKHSPVEKSFQWQVFGAGTISAQ